MMILVEKRKSTLWLAVLVVILSLVVAGCGSKEKEPTKPADTKPAAPAAPASELDQLVQKAKAEGKVVYYTNMGQSNLDQMLPVFQKKYPEVKVESYRLASSDLMQRFDSEYAAGLRVADVYMMSVEDYITNFKNYEQINVPEGKNFPKEYFDGKSVLASMSPLIAIYNTKEIQPNDVPKQWEDLLNPKLKGKIGLVDPRRAEAFYKWYYAIAQAKGEDFIKKLLAQQPKLYPTGGPLSQAVASGEVSFAAHNYGYELEPLKKKGAPVEGIMTIAPTVTLDRHQMIVKGAPHPNAARLFINWMMTPEGQEAINGKGKAAAALKNTPTALPMPAGVVRPDALKVVAFKAAMDKMLAEFSTAK